MGRSAVTYACRLRSVVVYLTVVRTWSARAKNINAWMKCPLSLDDLISFSVQILRFRYADSEICSPCTDEEVYYRAGTSNIYHPCRSLRAQNIIAFS